MSAAEGVNAEQVAKALGGKKSGSGWIAQCVAHDDANPSMWIADREKGGVVVKCFAGCDRRELMHVLMARGLWPERKNGKEIIAEYDYKDEHGKLVYQVVKFAPKDFRQRKPDGPGGWTWTIKGVKPVPYRLPEVLAAVRGRRSVFVVEGEKDVETMRSHGFVATCNSGGAGKWTYGHSKWLKGANVIIIPDNDEPGRKHAEQVRTSLNGIADTISIIQIAGAKDISEWFEAGHDQEDLDQLVMKSASDHAVADQAPQRDVIVERLADIQAKPITWLWPGRIARGKPTLIAGHPGLGKSQITVSMSAIATTGGLWPVDRSKAPIGSVLYLSAEDDPADTIRPRLEAAGADITKVHIVKAVIDTTSAGEQVQRAFNLKADIRRLEHAILDIGDVVLVIIDPVSAYLGTGDSHNNAEMRGLLAPLSEMAARQNVAVVLVSHLNKSGVGAEALMRVTGSLAFVAAARAAYIVAKDPTDEERRLFIPAKNNIAKDVGGLAFKVEGCPIANGIETSRVLWEAAPVTDVTADDILRQPTDPEEKGARDEAEAFLVDLLAHGPVAAKEVFVNARDAGVSEKTLRRAAHDIGVEKSKTGMDGGWIWKLPSKMANCLEDGQPKVEAIFGATGHLRCPRCAGEGCRWCGGEEAIVQ